MNKDIVLALFEYIKERNGNTQISNHLTDFVQNTLKEKGLKSDSDEILDNISYLINIGVLKPFLDVNNARLPFFSLTAFGRKCLERGEIGLLDINSEIERLKNKILRIGQSLDETVEIYFAESLHSFHTNSFLASVILTGGASEKLILLLNDSIIEHLKRNRISVNKDFSNNNISKKFNAINGYIGSIKNELPKELTDGLHNRLTGIFENMRISRNEVGHPEINYKYIDRDNAEAHLLLLPSYCELIYKLKYWFDNN